jgi:hypothetical protein
LGRGGGKMEGRPLAPAVLLSPSSSRSDAKPEAEFTNKSNRLGFPPSPPALSMAKKNFISILNIP